MKPYQLSIEEAGRLLHKGKLSSTELTRSVLERIDAVESRIDAFITIAADQALEQAATADRRFAAGEATPLTGIPLALKDLLCTRGTRTTCASRILEDFVPPYNATVVSRLLDAGAVLVGKTNMDEFAMGSSNENSGFKPTRNPWNTACVPGGSSGGSAAAVAADMCLGALGSDTGGSIRQPGSHCSVVGLKPTYGRVSRFGLVAFASSLDQIGPMTKTVGDNALLLSAIAGYDPSDSTSAQQDVPDFPAACQRDMKGLRIGIPEEYRLAEGLHPDVQTCVGQAIETLAGLGARPVDIALPTSEHAVAAYYVIAPCEASSNLARYDGVKYGFRSPDDLGLLDMIKQSRTSGFGAEVQRRIIIGTYCLSAGYYDAYYGKASQVRTLIRNDFNNAFGQCDVILSPVAPTPAFAIGENIDDPLTMYLSDMYTLAANLAGIPGMSVPCGFSREGLPIGLQILGKPFDEETLYTVAANFERATDFHLKKPDL
jgi:aspartyl-tRNA(Asn)/glutamyl-tRNA(Gln) amidotransferase subunit A